jgi:hypothetical protein
MTRSSGAATWGSAAASSSSPHAVAFSSGTAASSRVTGTTSVSAPAFTGGAAVNRIGGPVGALAALAAVVAL